MSNLSSFVISSTINTATVFSCNANIYCDGVLCVSVADKPGLGEYCEGGHIICKAASKLWIVSPRCAEVSRTWYLRDNANTLANACTSCTGWFVPTIAQLQNPGYLCRNYWDLFSSTNYWSSTDVTSTTSSCLVNFSNGTPGTCIKSTALCVRSFRCVSY
jgi:hypothetical protein